MTRYRSLLALMLYGFLGISFSFLPPASSVAHAGGTIKIDDNRYVAVGMGLRTSFNLVEDAAPGGSDWSKDFNLDSFRFYMGGQIHPIITFEFNTEHDSERVRVLDGVLKFGFNDLFNVWVGRFLPPSDRSNLSGPYYLNAWVFPFVQNYPQTFAGRDTGAAVWGQIGKGMFKYQVGAFEGKGDTAPAATAPNQKDNLLYAGRLVLNLWDPEPGYYNSSTYYGSMNVLAIGVSAMTQADAVGVAGAAGDFTGWNVDLLVERSLGTAGVATLEGAYYDYDLGGVADPIPGGLFEGNGYFALASYLLPGKVMGGGVQPMVRYQKFEFEGAGTGDRSILDFGLSYIISGHNARITATYSKEDPATAGLPDFSAIRVGLQFQI